MTDQNHSRVRREDTEICTSPKQPRRWVRVLLLVLVLALGSALRLVNLGESPPGLNQDEAINAWNAYCLLRTGKDQTGAPWPIFYSRAIGENRSTLAYYVWMPFQLLGGLNVTTTRLPAVFAGIACLLTISSVGNRLFGYPVGLVSAVFLCTNPWHLHLSRWGHEANIGPLLGTLPLAVLLASGIPIGPDGGDRRHLKRGLAMLAGTITGLVCYGYPAIRIFVPVLMLFLVAVTWTRWWECLQTREGRSAVGIFLVAVTVTVGPLVAVHLFDPAIGRRAQMTVLWHPDDNALVRIGQVVDRYVRHFGVDWLFLRGDQYLVQSPPDSGQFDVCLLPCMLLGAFAVAREARTSASHRILLIWVLAYPVGDVFWHHASMHALRSAPGMSSLIVLAALGAVRGGTWIFRWFPRFAWPACLLLSVMWGTLSARYLVRFFIDYNCRPAISRAYHVDLVQACRWLRPRLGEFDAVFMTTRDMNQPFAIALVVLGYDPAQWFSDGWDVIATDSWDVYTRVGKLRFLYDASALHYLRTLEDNTEPNRVLFLVRPGEFGMERPIHTVPGPKGEASLWACEVTL